MAFNDVEFNRGQGGLGRPLANRDHVSGMVFYITGALPAGFAADDRIKKVFSVIDAENLGIVDTHTDETKGTGGQVTVTGTWIVGEIVRIEIDGASLGQFILTATTITSLVAGLVAAINAGTNTGIKHGWVATDANPIITLVQPSKLGIQNNTGTPLVFVDRNAADTAGSAGGSSTDVQFSGGAGSQLSYIHYHISEYFRLQPDGELYVSLNAQNTYDGAEIETLQTFAKGDIRQSGVYVSHEVYAASHLTITQGVLDTLETNNQPMVVAFHSDFSLTTAAALSTLTTLSNERVSAILGEEGDWHQLPYSNTKTYQIADKITFQGASYQAKTSTTGNTPWDATKWSFLRENLVAISGFSISNFGAVLGHVSFASVHQSIAWVERFNLVTGTGLDEIGFATGELDKDISLSLKNTLDDFHYTFMRKHDGISGSYNNDSWTAISETDDFATVENNRTMDKAVRNIRTNVVPNLSSPLYVNEDGTLSEDTIALFKNDAERATLQMVRDGELSAQQIKINPAQDVLATSKIIIAVTLVPVGVARKIEINIGFAAKLA